MTLLVPAAGVLVKVRAAAGARGSDDGPRRLRPWEAEAPRPRQQRGRSRRHRGRSQQVKEPDRERRTAPGTASTRGRSLNQKRTRRQRRGWRWPRRMGGRGGVQRACGLSRCKLVYSIQDGETTRTHCTARGTTLNLL